MRGRGRAARAAAVAAVTVALLWGVGRAVDGPDVRAALAGWPWWRLSWPLTAGASILLLRGLRAQLLLPPGPPWRAVMGAVAAGVLASLVTPLRLGVVVRPVLLQRRTGLPFGVGLSGVLAERLLDVLALLALVAVAAGWALPGAAGQRVEAAAGMLAGLAAVLVVALLALMAAGPRLLTAWEARLDGRPLLSWAVRLLRRVGEGSAAMTRAPRRTGLAVALTAVMWALGVSTAAVVLGGFAEIVPAGRLSVGFWATVMVANAAVPTPGSVGAYEAAGMAALAAHGVPRSTGLAASLLCHGSALLVQLVVAGGFVLAEGGRHARAQGVDPSRLDD